MPAECPILVWMLSLNREYTRDEYNQCYELTKECVPHLRVKPDPEDPESFRIILENMLPLLMMRHRRISRTKWRDCQTATGKHWIEQIEFKSPDDMPPEKFLNSMIGYHLAHDGSMIGMAMTQGKQKQVINIGLGIKQLAVEPRGVSVAAYAESLSHKLTSLEMSFLSSELGDEVVLRRLCILLSLKSAYIKAIGQPIGFDWSRLEFNIPAETVRGDDHPLTGWEFRVWRSHLGVGRRDMVIEENYQCACAFFRGTPETKFIWDENTKDLEQWVQYLTIDQMIKVIPKLLA